MSIRPIFLMILVTIIGFLFIIIASERVRNNIRKNASFIVILHHALMYQRQKVQDTAEFTNSKAEMGIRDHDFREFAIAWLQIHHQNSHVNSYDDNTACHTVAENTWTAIAEEQCCLKKILEKATVINVPLIFCTNANLDFTYDLWSKCVETNTQYVDKQDISIHFEAAPSQSNKKKALLTSTVIITINQTANQWKWVVK